MSEQIELCYTVLFEQAEDGGYTMTCPAFLGLVAEGDTLEEARHTVKEAILCYLESLARDGKNFPPDREADIQTDADAFIECIEISQEEWENFLDIHEQGRPPRFDSEEALNDDLQNKFGVGD